ncbi:branched-chain amino acid ABC transporter permease [Amaricoccus solimangrovi]|uniref:Branched-chain amino acid ABC transporter permease n=2 Tax=Amaricoccus solimangrovi TaxID=2589815 RepID=A0A501WGW9_9RHOB|nr:branched-chain amino acid ABC transporter permease [Amaricoccus solimangrovi]
MTDMTTGPTEGRSLVGTLRSIPPGVLWTLGFGLAALSPLVITDQYLFRMFTMIAIWSILALGQNIITGFCGQLSYGQAAFYGIGAYTSALLTIHLGLPFPITLICAVALSAAFGLLIGYPATRIGGDYLFLVTIGFAEICRLVFLNWDSVTNGAVGLPNIPPISLFGHQLWTNQEYFLLSLALLAVVVAITNRISASDIGRCFLAVREDEIAARAVGINVARYKLLAFGLGAGISGVAGAIVAHFLSYVGPDMFTNWESTLVFAIVLVGGLGSVPGTILGAAVIIGIFESARGISDYRLYIAGGLLLFVVLVRPQGLLGAVKLRRPGPSPAVDPEPEPEKEMEKTHGA